MYQRQMEKDGWQQAVRWVPRRRCRCLAVHLLSSSWPYHSTQSKLCLSAMLCCSTLTGRQKHRMWQPVLTDPPPLLHDVAVVLVSPKASARG